MAQTIGTLLLQLRADTSAFVKGLSDARQYAFDSSEQIVASLGKIGTQLGKLDFGNFKNGLKSLENLGAIMAGVGTGVAAAVIAVAESTAQQAKQLDKLSQSYGLSIEQVSGLRAASKLTGVDMETLTVGMSRLSTNMLQFAATGGGRAAVAFDLLKLSAADVTKLLQGSGGMNEVLLRSADIFSKMPDGPTKLAAATKLFGAAGAAMIPFLNQGRDGIQQMLDLSKELGLTWSANDAAAAKQFAAQVDILELKSTAFKEQLARGVIPALDQLTTALVHTDASGQSIARTFGTSVGIAFKFAVEELMALVTWGQKAELELEKWKILAGSGIKGAVTIAAGIEAQPGAASATIAQKDQLEALDFQIKKIDDDYQKFLADLNAPPKTPKVPPPPGSVPGFGTPDDITQLGNALDKLSDKTKQLLDKEEGDKVAAQMDKIAAQIRDIASFESQHPGAVWVDLNRQVQQLTSSLESLRFKQQQILAEAGAAAGKAELGEVLKTPIQAPLATGQTAAQAALLKLQQDSNEQERLAISLYNETATASEKWANKLAGLNVLLAKYQDELAQAVPGTADWDAKQQALAQTTEAYNRALQQERDSMNAAYDPAVRFAEALRKINDLQHPTDAQGNVLPSLLTETAAWRMNKDAIDQNRVAMEKDAMEQNVWGSGFKAALNDFSKSMGTFQQSLNRGMTTALNGLHSAFQSFFQNIFNGTKTLGQAFAQLGQDILNSVAAAIAQVIADWLVMKALTALGFGDQVVNQKKQNADLAASDAAAAAAGTLAITSAVYLPPVPEILSGVAYAMGMTYAALASAAGGMDVGRDQLVQVHAQEMILPARLANPIRDLAARPAPALSPAFAGAGASGGGGGGHTFHIAANFGPIYALDSAGFDQVVARNRNAFVKHTVAAIQDAFRDGRLKPKR